MMLQCVSHKPAARLTGLCLAAVLLPAASLVAQTNSRLGAHAMVTYTAPAAQFVSAGPRIHKILDANGAMMQSVRDFKTANPSGKTVIRVYTGKAYALQDNPTTCADDWWNTILAPQLNGLSPSDRALIDYVEGPNEGDSTPTWSSVAAAQWFNTFWIRLAYLIANAGFKPCAFSISVGNPPGDINNIHQMLDAIVPALRACKSYNGAWSYHSYTIPYSKDLNAELWSSLRYRQYYEYFAQYYPDLVDLPLLLTEGGADCQPNMPGGGWRGGGDLAKFIDWLEWYDGQLMQDPYVVGCTLFQTGAFASWQAYDIDEVCPWLAGHLATATPPGVPGVPTALTASAGNGQASLYWTGTPLATHYNVKRSTASGGPYTTIGSVMFTGFTDSGLTNGVTYYYVVSAVNTTGGESANSSEVSATLLNYVAIEDFESMPSWSSSYDANWGSNSIWSIVPGGQSGDCLEVVRPGTGSSSKVLIHYNLLPNTTYTMSVYVRCPSSSGAYWAETAYKLGENSAQDFDNNSTTWTLIKKFSDTGENGNGDAWTQYSLSFNTGSTTAVSVGYKLGSSSGTGPTVKWDTFRILASPATPAISRSPSTLSPSCNQGSDAAGQTFTVQNTGGDTLNYTISDNVTWLSCSPTSGTSTGEADTITVTYSTSSLSAGTYNGTITISDPNATNNPQTITVTLTVNSAKQTVEEDFESMPSWSSSYDGSWGSAASWSIVSGGQSGNALQASRGSQGSSAKVKVYTITAGSAYTISAYIKCPSYGGAYWAECAYKLGSNTASDFDNNGGTWTMVKKFANDGTNGNGNTWTQYSTTFNSGTNTQISVGFKLGSYGGAGPTVQWDTLRVQ
ncbi:MAG: hypothetical protein GX616_19605 [Planctomycetes bacterium]|nr:hypothetical protein [Planctomycetota bacterium]